MKILSESGNENIATVYVGEIAGKPLEFAESTPTPFGRQEKWVIIVSCLSGCPVRCLMCDAGQFYRGCLTKEEILEQIDYLVAKRFPDKNVTAKKCKIQFTRMGEPTFNPAVLAVLEELPQRYTIPELIVSLSTIGPKNAAHFLNKLLHIKNKLYNKGNFQLQFSVHTTDVQKRNKSALKS